MLDLLRVVTIYTEETNQILPEEITLTKVQLLEKQLCLGEKASDLDEKHKEWSRKLSDKLYSK